MSDRKVEMGKVSELLVHLAQVDDSATYVCTATNTHGTLMQDFHLLVQGMVVMVIEDMVCRSMVVMVLW